MAIKVFISHSSEDVALARGFIECLLACMELRDKDIRCTSVPGHKLPVGAEVAATLKNELSGSAVVIGLLTPHALSSSWVLFELGAAWGAGKRIFPVVGGGLDMSNLPGPLGGHHAVRASDENGMTQLLEEVEKLVAVPARSRAKAQAAIAKLIADQSASAGASPKPPTKPLKTKTKEAMFDGIPFSELVAVLASEKIIIPAALTGTDKPADTTLLDLFVSNCHIIAAGVASSWGSDTVGGFFYHFVALKLLPFRLVKFDKLPASRVYRQISLSPIGDRFISYFKRLSVKRSSS